MRFSVHAIIILLISCTTRDEIGNLVVDSLDMSSNDFTKQLSYKSEFEIFQNDSRMLNL